MVERNADRRKKNKQRSADHIAREELAQCDSGKAKVPLWLCILMVWSLHDNQCSRQVHGNSCEMFAVFASWREMIKRRLKLIFPIAGQLFAAGTNEKSWRPWSMGEEKIRTSACARIYPFGLVRTITRCKSDGR